MYSTGCIVFPFQIVALFAFLRIGAMGMGVLTALALPRTHVLVVDEALCLPSTKVLNEETGRFYCRDDRDS